MATPIGPLFAAGQTDITKSGYKITFLPDAHNDDLQTAGQPPIYYWMPNEVRLAKKDSGDYKFSMIHFAGVRSSETNVGVTTTDEEVAGGILTFSTTSAPPGDVLRDAQNDLLDQLRGNNDKYWGYRTNIAPMFRFFPIVSNTTAVSNISPTQDGGVPAATPGKAAFNGSAAPIIRAVRSYAPVKAPPRTVPRAYRGTNMDPMFVRMWGQGAGSINPDADNAYSALLGSTAAAIVYNGFHMGTGIVAVSQNLMVRVVSPLMTIDITGDWSRVQDHLSAEARAGGLFWSADVKAQFDSMRESGIIEVKTFVDLSLPNADKLQEYMDKRSDLVFNKFLDQAKQVIFDPAPFNEQPAQASGGFLGFGGGVALKLREQRTSLSLQYHETREIAYLQSYPLSGTMDGLYDVIKADPTAEQKYFMNVDLGDWERKVARIVKPVVNWPDPAHKWVGEPVAFLSVEIGYPNTQGALEWDGHVFSPADGPEAQWNTATLMKQQSEVANPPAGWAPDKTFVKRAIHFTEPPSAFDNPYACVQVEKNEVDLDPDNGTPLNDITLEVRVDAAGTLSVGPTTLGAVLDAPNQTVEVTFTPTTARKDGSTRDPVKLTWSMADQDQPRYWMLYTGEPDFDGKYSYQVRVVVKGSLFTKGMEWVSPVYSAGGSGPLTCHVPTPDEDGVQKKDVPLFALAVNGKLPSPAPTPPAMTGHGTPPPATGHVTPPPATKGTPSTIGAITGWSYAPVGKGERSGPPPAEQVVFTGFQPAQH